ncbi:hypothetical protein YPPY36_4710, partial [Yersinia pestis PY-36]
MAPDNGWGR